ncbi:MAG: diacylglycerol kinase family protein [Verrucomicrobiia bacterium]
MCLTAEKDVFVIHNPAAKGHKSARLADEIRRLSPRIVLRSSDQPDGARKLAEHAVREGFHTIVAAGGDGTINEVVNGIADSKVRFGLLPSGTMNVFASELGLPSGLADCWEIIEYGATRRVDLGMANGHYFVQLAGIGLDAQIVQQTDPETKRTLGPLSYIMSAAVVAARTPPRLVAEAEGRGEVEGSFILIGNGRFYGGPFVLFQDAKIDDGLLDVLVFHSLGYFDILRYLTEVLVGKHTEMGEVDYFQTRCISVVREEGVPFEVDGELAGAVPVTFSAAPLQLEVLVPV